MRLHKEGTWIIAITIIALFVLNLLLQPFFTELPVISYLLVIASVVMLFLVVQFFRVPKRIVTYNDDMIYSPCDGKVVVIEEVDEPEFLKEKRIQISIFMSPLNVHVNWSPMNGVVKYFKYHPGKYLVAWHPKSSTENERTTMVFDNGRFNVLLRQIAGAVARRIIWYVEENKEWKQHDEIGFIRFGSRVDLFLPLNADIKVKIGDKVQGKLSEIAEIKS